MLEVIGIDHIYISVADLDRSVAFYDRVLLDTLGFRKNSFVLGGEPHVQYYNRHFGYVLRPARNPRPPDSYSCGLHHLCWRVDSIEEVKAVAQRLNALAITTSAAAHYPEYAADYWAVFFTDPDGLRLEITNYRQERRERHDRW